MTENHDLARHRRPARGRCEPSFPAPRHPQLRMNACRRMDRRAETLAIGSGLPRLRAESGKRAAESGCATLRAKPRVPWRSASACGQSLLEMPRPRPSRTFRVEVHRRRGFRYWNGVLTADCRHLRVFDCDAIEVLNQWLPTPAWNRVLASLPPIWHKKKHNKPPHRAMASAEATCAQS